MAYISYLAERMVPDGPLFEVAVVHHTECGTGLLADEEFRRGFGLRTGRDDAALAAEAVTDPVATVRADVEQLLASPRVSPRISASGHVYDVVTGLVSTVRDAERPQRRPAGDVVRT